MKKDSIHKYVWIELAVWFLILSLIVFGIRLHRYHEQKELHTYQIFLPDVDGMIVGSPVKFMGVQVGYIQKINIVGNDLYVKFIVTEKGLSIPAGSIATVEFSGLGGSKSLEIYPPTKESLATDKLIVVQRPKRIHDSLGLLNDMFDKIGSLTSRCSYFAKELAAINPVNPKLTKNRESLDKIFTDVDNWVNKCENCRKKFHQRLKGEKE